eukprot:scaffold44213_cov810-Skeletonema_marinoi.AAC.1
MPGVEATYPSALLFFGAPPPPDVCPLRATVKSVLGHGSLPRIDRDVNEDFRLELDIHWI